MAQPLLDFLEGRAKAALPFLRAGVAQGLSPTAIIASLEGKVETFRRQAMLDIIHALQGVYKLPQYLRITPKATPLAAEAHVTSPSAMDTNYQYVTKLDNPDLPAPIYITVVSDVPLSQIAIMGQAQLMYLGEKYGLAGIDEFQRSTVDIVSASINPSTPVP